LNYGELKTLLFWQEPLLTLEKCNQTTDEIKEEVLAKYLPDRVWIKY
jgi:hypothetical protein